MRKNSFKKFSAFALIGVMMLGSTSNVVAYNNSQDYKVESGEAQLIGGVTADYTLECDFGDGWTVAATEVTSLYDVEKLSASVDIYCEVLVGSSSYEEVGSDYKKVTVESGDLAEASVDLVTVGTGYYVEMYSESTHEAYVKSILGSETDVKYLDISFD